MNERMVFELGKCKTDVTGVRERLGNDDALYITCLQEFIEDSTIKKLEYNIRMQRWDDALTDAHALKGLAGNMGFIPLMQDAARLITYFRNKNVENIQVCYEQLHAEYQKIVKIINQNE